MKRRKKHHRNPPTITLRTVIVHMEHMEQRLTARLDGHDEKFKQLEGMIHSLDLKLSRRMDDLEERLTKRIDALDEDLTATMLDSIAIRRHVGMPVPDED